MASGGAEAAWVAEAPRVTDAATLKAKRSAAVFNGRLAMAGKFHLVNMFNSKKIDDGKTQTATFAD